MNQVTNPNQDRKTTRTSADTHAAKDPLAQYDHHVQELTEAEQKAIVGGWWTSQGMLVWQGGW